MKNTNISTKKTLEILRGTRSFRVSVVGSTSTLFPSSLTVWQDVIFCLTFQGPKKTSTELAATKELLVLLQSVSHINLFLSGKQARNHLSSWNQFVSNYHEILVGK